MAAPTGPARAGAGGDPGPAGGPSPSGSMELPSGRRVSVTRATTPAAGGAGASALGSSYSLWSSITSAAGRALASLGSPPSAVAAHPPSSPPSSPATVGGASPKSIATRGSAVSLASEPSSASLASRGSESPGRAESPPRAIEPLLFSINGIDAAGAPRTVTVADFPGSVRLPRIKLSDLIAIQEKIRQIAQEMRSSAPTSEVFRDLSAQKTFFEEQLATMQPKYDEDFPRAWDEYNRKTLELFPAPGVGVVIPIEYDILTRVPSGDQESRLETKLRNQIFRDWKGGARIKIGEDVLPPPGQLKDATGRVLNIEDDEEIIKSLIIEWIMSRCPSMRTNSELRLSILQNLHQGAMATMCQCLYAITNRAFLKDREEADRYGSMLLDDPFTDREMRALIFGSEPVKIMGFKRLDVLSGGEEGTYHFTIDLTSEPSHPKVIVKCKFSNGDFPGMILESTMTVDVTTGHAQVEIKRI